MEHREQNVGVEDFSDLIVRRLPFIMLIFDSSRRVAECTDMFLTAAGISSCTALLGKTLNETADEYMDGSAFQRLDTAFSESSRCRETVSGDYFIDFGGTGNSREYTACCTSIFGADGHFRGWILLFQDITDERNEVRRVESINQAKSVFLSNTVNTIRTTMNAILDITEFILREPVSETVKSYSLDIRNVGMNLFAAVNEVLDFANIEAGHIKLTDTNYYFASLLNDVINTVRVRIVEKQLRFLVYLDSGIPNRLCGDVVRIRQILMNLLGNAIKHTDNGSITLDVSLSAAESLDDSIALVIRVRDTGVGLDTEEFSGDFFRDIVRHGVEGTGLGMIITKNLCTFMGGNMFFTRQYGKGSEFVVRIPQKVRSKEPLARVDNPSAVRALLYEDDEENACAVIYGFENLDITYAWAQNEEGFISEMKTGLYTHVFTSYANMQIARSLAEVMKVVGMADVLVVVMADHGARVSDPEARVLFFPVYAISIANVFNNADDGDQPFFDWGAFTEQDALALDDVQTNLTATLGEDSSGRAPFIPLTTNTDAGMKNPFPNEGFGDYLSASREAALVGGGSDNKLRTLERQLVVINGLDLAEGKNHTGSFENLIDVMYQFCRDFDPLMANIRDTFGREDWKNYAVYVHAMKGVLATIGAVSLAEQAKAFEMAAKNGDIAFCTCENERLLSDLTSFYDELLKTSLLDKEDEGSDGTLPFDEALEKLDIFSKACYNGDSTTIDPLVDLFTHVTLEAPYNELWQRSMEEIARLVESYEFGAAEEAVLTLKASLLEV